MPNPLFDTPAPGAGDPAADVELDLGDDRADIVSHDTYLRGVPHATFARLRRDDPVSWVDEPDGRGFWAVTRYHDVLAVSRRPEVFSSAQGIRLEDMTPEECEARRTIMEMDPPQHTAVRRLVSRPFTPRGVQQYEALVRSLTRDVLDAAEGSPAVEFVGAIARQIPLRLLGRLLGVPDADGEWLVERGDALIGNTDPEFTDFVVDRTDTDPYRLLPFRSPVALELFDYAEGLIGERRSCPGGDLMSALVAPMADGEVLTDLQLKNFFTLMVAAGNDTTRYSMAAGMAALAERPALWAGLRADPDRVRRIPALVEEILRWSTVTMHFRRTAVADTELAGRRIRRGDKVVMWYVAANFDDAAFGSPYRFVPARDPNDHTTFGRHSAHLCLGAHLARLELRILLEELLERVEAFSVDGTPERLRSNFIAGIKRLPLALSWQRGGAAR